MSVMKPGSFMWRDGDGRRSSRGRLIGFLSLLLLLATWGSTTVSAGSQLVPDERSYAVEAAPTLCIGLACPNRNPNPTISPVFGHAAVHLVHAGDELLKRLAEIGAAIAAALGGVAVWWRRQTRGRGR